ncbi:MAG TPA: hypothetical protein VK165_09595, partial [Azonexus sp.]|nr:hypothetical protein [Azonexus sp.]
MKIRFHRLGGLLLAASFLCPPAPAADYVMQLAYLRPAVPQAEGETPSYVHSEREVPPARRAIDTVEFLDDNN